jgi:hypothetical protein
MEAIAMKKSLCTYLVVSGLCFVAAPAYAEYKCDRQSLTRVDAIACAKAAEGIESLQRYVWRTRHIYNLWIADYIRP